LTSRFFMLTPCEMDRFRRPVQPALQTAYDIIQDPGIVAVAVVVDYAR
jgi:hypothetical protein